MTNLNGQQHRAWKREEVRFLPPFETADGALRECHFSPDSAEEFIDAERTYLTRERFLVGLSPRFRLRVETEELTATTGLSLEDMELALAVRDLDFKKYEVLTRWPLTEIPEEWPTRLNSPRPFASSNGLDFVLVVALKNPQAAGASNHAHRAGSVLARRVFSVRPEADNLSFPIDFVDFPVEKWPADTLWAIKYLEDPPDFRKPVKEVLVLWMNKKVEQKLRQLEMTSAGSVSAQLIAAEVFAEIARRVLVDIPAVSDDGEDDEAIRLQVLRALQAMGDLDAEAVIELANEDPDVIKSLVQRGFSLVDSIRNSNPRR